ncbi:hypothetical protein AB0467_22525 [Streptomyces sp. NPDC052095]|uniref:hypothetical protein n=1 Tax=unclassified Streptomyces TaxID=2593676 RepID=UPI00344B06BE
MLGRLFGRGGAGAEADPYALPVPFRKRASVYELRALGDRRVLALVEAAGAGDWAAVKEALAPFDLGRDHAVLGQLADVAGVEEWIGRAVQEDGEHRAAALLISGARQIIWGWEARTSARATDVSRDQWRVFHERLGLGEARLLEAAELRPEWITPWRQLLTSGRGMSLGPVVNRTRLDAALRRDPLDLDVHLAWISQLQPRWGGEPGQALAFAREVFARAPHGSRLGCAIAMAHIEEAVEAGRADAIENPEIRAELSTAAERSILHPDHVRIPGWQYDFNTFAMALSMAGEWRTARRVYQVLDGACTTWPWEYFGNPRRQYARGLRRT